MPLNLSDIVKNPDLLTFKIPLPSGELVILRPLEIDDVDPLAQFLEKLSPMTREYYVLDSYDASTAKELCDAISHYDKLRFVLVNDSNQKIIALFEFSFDIPENDLKRYRRYNIQLDSKTDCRVGPCITDNYQNRGIGSATFPKLFYIAQQFGQKRVILWGGVFTTNKRAINFYNKIGFKKLGIFKNKDGKESVDMIINI